MDNKLIKGNNVLDQAIIRQGQKLEYRINETKEKTNRVILNPNPVYLGSIKYKYSKYSN